MPHKFEPHRRHLLDGQERRQRLPPEPIFSFLPLQPHHQLADIGCGTGYFSLPLAEKVPQGQVFAVDISEEMLNALKEKLAQHPMPNIAVVKSEELAIPLPAGSLDGAFLAFVLHETEDRLAFLRIVKGLLKPQGWLGVVEWVKREMPIGPPLAERLSPQEAGELATQAGLKVVVSHPLGQDFYILVLKN